MAGAGGPEPSERVAAAGRERAAAWSSGVGKTHLAIGIALAQIGLDQYCRCYPATTLVQKLQKARADYSLPQALEQLDRYQQLLNDDNRFAEATCYGAATPRSTWIPPTSRAGWARPCRSARGQR